MYTSIVKYISWIFNIREIMGAGSSLRHALTEQVDTYASTRKNSYNSKCIHNRLASLLYFILIVLSATLVSYQFIQLIFRAI